MLKMTIFLCAMGLGASSQLLAGEIIQVEKLSKAQLQQALKAAPDDAIIEFHGQSKTKAQLRAELRAMWKPIDPARARQLDQERHARFVAAAKALQDQQDSDVAAENARTMKDFEELRSQ